MNGEILYTDTYYEVVCYTEEGDHEKMVICENLKQVNKIYHEEIAKKGYYRRPTVWENGYHIGNRLEQY